MRRKNRPKEEKKMDNNGLLSINAAKKRGRVAIKGREKKEKKGRKKRKLGKSASVGDVGVGETQDFREVGGGDFDLIADLARAEEDHIEVGSGFVEHGFELLFHADGGASAVNISGEREKLLRFDHFDGLPGHGLRRFLEIELGIDRHDENEMFA